MTVILLLNDVYNDLSSHRFRQVEANIQLDLCSRPLYKNKANA